MKIIPAGTAASEDGSSSYFSGRVRLTPLLNAPAPARLRGAQVTFEAGARTAWHTHPLGQTLIVTAGAGLAQTEGTPAVALRPGDVVWFAPGEKHWHGASAHSDMTHIALQEVLDGSVVDWLEQVSDTQYAAASEQTAPGQQNHE